MKKFSDLFKTKSTRIGSYAVVSAIVVVVLLVIANLIVNRLPSLWTEYDLSDTSVLDISEETENIVKGADRDIDIYWIVQGNTEEKLLQSLLDRFQDMSKHINVTKIDPDRYPTFLKNYELTSVTNNSLIVESGDRYRYIDHYKIFVSIGNNQADYDTTFDGEGQLTTAINYVLNGKMPIFYATSGHGETELDTDYIAAIGRTNSEVKELLLASLGEIPEDCDLLIINAPMKDFTADETALLKKYVDEGGRVALITVPPQEATKNLDDFVNYFGMKRVDGILVESDTTYFASQFGAISILPVLQSHEITDPLLAKKYPIFLPLASGIQALDNVDDVTYTALATTSETAFSKIAGYELQTYEKEDGDADGPFDVAVLAEKGEGKIIWFSSAGISNSEMSEMVYGTNEDFLLNALSYLSDQEETISIRAKEITNETLVVSEKDTLIWTIVFIGVIPLACLLAGIVMIIKRRKRK